MFLEALQRRNPRLIEAAVALHQRGELPASSYVIDLDAVTENAAALAGEAEGLGIELVGLASHAGRGGPFLEAMSAGGIERASCLELACARAARAHGVRVGHIGRLVQVPRAEAAAAAAAEPEAWTVFSLEKAREAAQAAAERGREQALLARIRAPGDRLELGEEGGFPAMDVRRVAEELDWLDGTRFAGITSYPTLIFDPDQGRAVATRNLKTIAWAIEDLRRDARTDIVVDGAAKVTTTANLATLAEAGITRAEPGQALTGTTPMHALGDLAERPAMLYLTEVSHHYAARAYCFGGGIYVDRFPVSPDMAPAGGDGAALTGTEPSLVALRRARAQLPEPPTAGHYLQLDVDGDPPRAGESVVLAFRTQAYLTRAHIAGLRGVDSERPTVAGIWDATGRELSWPP